MAEYATLEELKRYLRIPEDDLTDDEDLSIALLAAAETIDRYCNRTFSTTIEEPEVRYFTPYYNKNTRKMVLPIDDVQNITDITFSVVDEDGTETLIDASYKLQPRAGFHPYTEAVFEIGGVSRTVNEIAVSALWGWNDVPQSIKKANLLQAARLFKRRDAPFGVAGSPEMGSQLRLLAKLDPDVEVLVTNYKRHWSAV